MCRKLRRTAVVGLGLLVIATSSVAALDESAAVRKIIESNNSKAEEYYRTGQIDRVAELFATDARQYPNHMPPLVGREAIRSFWTQAVATGQWVFTLKTEEVVVRGDLAVERGAYTLTFTPRQDATTGAAPFSDRGNYLVQWRRVGKQWLIAVDCPSSETPMPATK